MADRLTGMAVFAKATELGSFSAAAAALGMSSQMVGKHVRALEDRLGTPLLRRSTRRQSVTEAGRLFYERCRAVLALVEEAEAEVEGSGAAPRGLVRISAPVGFGASRLAPVLIQFMERHPAIQVELVLTDRYVDLIEEGYDAALRLGPIADTSLAARDLAPHRQLICASPGYLAANGTPHAPGDLADHACLGFVNASGRPYVEWRFTRNGVEHPIEIRSRFQANDGRVLAAAAVAGRGIVLQPEAVLREHVDAGRLVPILGDYVPPSRPMLLMFVGRPTQPPKMRVLIDHLVAAFPRHEHV
jgi:DNA-binding transcriptional LysR family regulator